MTNDKLLDVDEYLVAIKTGINYWHVLSGRENMVEMSEAEEYADRFTDMYPTAILKVKRVNNTKN